MWMQRYDNQKVFKGRIKVESVYDVLAARISDRIFGGLLPPNADVLAATCITLPAFKDATEEQAQYIFDELRAAFDRRIALDYYKLAADINGIERRPS